MSPRIVMLAALVLFGCGDEDESTPAPAECSKPNRLVGDACLEPGVQDDGCPAGTLGLDDGSCRPAGIAPEMCGEGFVHDGDVGCTPILPPEACSLGLMAVPGDRECRTVMPCAAGTWGGIPTDATTQHVDASYGGGDSDGTAQKPWTSVGAAVNAAGAGAIIAIAEGSYLENVLIADKAVRLWGVCPSKVEIAGSVDSPAILVVTASGTEIRGVAVRGAAEGLIVADSEGVIVDRVWIHDTALRGINVRGSATVVDSLVEKTREAGVIFGGSEGSLERTEIRDVVPLDSSLDRGIGVTIQLRCAGAVCDPDARSNVAVRGSRIERNHRQGLVVHGSDAEVERTVIVGTLPSPADQAYGGGLTAQACNASVGCDRLARANVTVRASLVEQNHHVGMTFAGADAIVESTVVRGTLPQVSDQQLGTGMVFQVYCTGDTCDPAATTSAAVRSSLVEQNHSMGVSIGGADVTLEATVVRQTLPRAVDQANGGGIYVHRCDTFHGCTTPVLARATIGACVIDENHDVGMHIGGADAEVQGTLVSNVTAQASGVFGDAIRIFSVLGPASASLAASRIERSARAGVGNFGSSVSLFATAIACTGFPLNGEPNGDIDFTFEDGGANGCGCPTPDGECRVRSVGLTPPPPLEP